MDNEQKELWPKVRSSAWDGCVEVVLGTLALVGAIGRVVGSAFSECAAEIDAWLEKERSK